MGSPVASPVDLPNAPACIDSHSYEVRMPQEVIYSYPINAHMQFIFFYSILFCGKVEFKYNNEKFTARPTSLRGIQRLDIA
jgi:hypothetical protein